MTTSNKRLRRLLITIGCILAFIGCSKHAVTSDLRQQLESSKPTNRENAVLDLRISNENDAVELLIVALDDPDYRVRSDAVEALGWRKARSATDKLIHLLGDTNMVVRGNAAEALGKIGDEKATGPLIKLLGDTMANKPKGPYSTEEWGGDADTAVAALIKITGTNFDFDAAKWRGWEAEKKSGRH